MSRKEAECIVNIMYDNCEIVLDAEDYVEHKIELIN